MRIVEYCSSRIYIAELSGLEFLMLLSLQRMDVYTVLPTSASSADGDPIVLRETSTTRLVFKPRVVQRPGIATASINGCFVFQRKGRNDSWADHNELQLTSLKATEWVKLELDSSELRTLLQDVAGLFREHAKSGVPRTRTHYLRLAASSDEVADLVNLDIRRFLTLTRKAGIDVLAEVLDWMSGLDDPGEVVLRLQQLEVGSLQRINSLIGITVLENLLTQWEENENVADEEFWQTLFEENAFVLTQVLPYPIVILQGKAYVGGKRFDNKGGNLADFLAANPLTRNAAIIEIKTPQTRLLGRRYRDQAFAISEELSGTINQVLNYRYQLMTDLHSIRKGDRSFDVYAPQGVVIAGNTGAELVTDEQRRSYETFRFALKDIVVIGYDELFAKLRALLVALLGSTE
jgi:hypothetical protein